MARISISTFTPNSPTRFADGLYEEAVDIRGTAGKGGRGICESKWARFTPQALSRNHCLSIQTVEGIIYIYILLERLLQEEGTAGGVARSIMRRWRRHPWCAVSVSETSSFSDAGVRWNCLEKILSLHRLFVVC